MIGLLQKKKIVNLPVSLKGNSKLICGKINVDMSPLEAQNKDIGAAWQTLLGEVPLTLRHRLGLKKRYLFSMREHI